MPTEYVPHGRGEVPSAAALAAYWQRHGRNGPKIASNQRKRLVRGPGIETAVPLDAAFDELIDLLVERNCDIYKRWATARSAD